MLSQIQSILNRQSLYSSSNILGSSAVFLLLVAAATTAAAISSFVTNNNHHTKHSTPNDSHMNPKAIAKHEASTARIWNRFANGYAKSPIQDQESYQHKLALTRALLTPQSKVLEFGCGTGGTALLHAPYVQHVHATDISSRMIDIAKDKLAQDEHADIHNVDYECIGMDSLQAPNDSYDVILGLSILHLLPNQQQVLQKVYALTKPGGYFVSSTACMADMDAAFWIRTIGGCLGYWGIIPKLNIMTKAELRASIEEAGFVLETEFHPGPDKAVFLVAKKKEEE